MFPVNQQYLACFLLNSDAYKCLSFLAVFKIIHVKKVPKLSSTLCVVCVTVAVLGLINECGVC